jgi:protein XagA
MLLGRQSLAHAGALLEPPGEGEIITTATFSTATRAFDANNRLVQIPTYQKFELASYIEYGVTPKVALIARPSFSVSPSSTFGPNAIFSTDLGLRVGLFDTVDTAISVQDQIHAPAGHTSWQGIIFDDSGVFSDELSLLATRSFVIGEHNAFIDGAVGYRWQSQDLPNEWHLDANFGIRSQPNLLWLVQSFATISTSAAPFGSYSALKLELSAVYDLSRTYSLQFGLFETVAGRNTGREFGPLAGFWYRF